MADRHCSNCKHHALSTTELPCRSCGFDDAFDKWEPIAAQPKPAEPSAMERAYDSMLGKPVALPPAEPSAGALPEAIEWLTDYVRRPSPGEAHLPYLRALLAAVQARVPRAADGSLSAESRLGLLNKLAENRGFESVTQALASLPLASQARVPQESAELDDEACDKAAAQTMDRVAAAKGLEHATHLNTDIATSHSLRRELIRAGFSLAARSSQPPAIPAERAGLVKEAKRSVLRMRAACYDAATVLSARNAAMMDAFKAIDALAAARAAPAQPATSGAAPEDVKRDVEREQAQMAARSFARESILIAFHAAENSTGAEPSVSIAARALSDALAAVDAALAAVPEAQRADDPIRALIAKHAEFVADDGAYPHYCYFELAYTRSTMWMAWLCSKPREDDPGRKVIARGQGETPDDACRAALAAMAASGASQPAPHGDQNG